MADNKFNIMDHLSNIGFGSQKQDGGGGADADTPDSLTKKAIDKGVQSIGKMFGINTDIEGKSAFQGFETDNIGAGLSPTNAGLMGIFRDSPGGILAHLLKYFTRDLPQGLTDGTEGGGSASGGGDFAGGGDFTASSAQGGGGDFPSHHSNAHFDEIDTRVSYGDKMVSSEAMVADLGNLKPAATPATGDSRGGGMEV